MQSFRRPLKLYETPRKRSAVFGQQCEEPREERLTWSAVGSHRARLGVPFQWDEEDSEGQLGIAGPVEFDTVVLGWMDGHRADGDTL